MIIPHLRATGGKIARGLCILAALALIPAPALAAGGDLPPLVRDIGYSLLLAGLLAVLFTRVKIPSIAAFLGAGVLAGPLGVALVTDPANIDTIAQLGFVLLLFMIGLEIDLRKLLGSGKTIIVTGMVQYPVTVLAGMVIVKLLAWVGVGGSLLSGSPFSALYFGILIAGSSTLLVIKLYAQSFTLDTVAGRTCLGLLIFQDIWAIIVIALQPSFASPSIGPVATSFVGIGLLAVTAVFAARYAATPGLRWIAKMPELILVAAISWCFIVLMVGVNLDHIAMFLFGFDPHIAVGTGMGALIAGVTLANSPYSTEIVSKVGVIRDFFIVLFFVGLGMGIPAPESVDVLIVAVLLAVIAVASRFLIFFPLLYLTGLDRRNAIVSAVRLAQISEFALVVAFLGLQQGHISQDLNSAVVLAFVLTALVTPTLFRAAFGLHERMARFLEAGGFRAPSEVMEDDEPASSIVLLGFHRFASSLLHDLSLLHPALAADTLVVDFNVSLHDSIRREGARVLYGNLANTETLRHAHLDQAKVAILTIPDEVLVGTSNQKLVQSIRGMSEKIVIIACATRLDEVDELYEAGADYVYVARLEASKSLTDAIGKALNGQIAEYRADREARSFPANLRDEVFR